MNRINTKCIYKHLLHIHNYLNDTERPHFYIIKVRWLKLSLFNHLIYI